jgi:opacity protein-like surface antigen
MQSRNLALAVASSLALMLAAQPADADQKIKTKSNIKNDRLADTCTTECLEAGYAWAKEKAVASDEDCKGKSEDFVQGCKNFVAEQSEAASPPADDTADANAATEQPEAAAPATEQPPQEETTPTKPPSGG